MKAINNSNPLDMEPKALLDWLIDSFVEKMPEEILSVEDMNNAARMLLRLTESYSYLNSLLSAAKITKRDTKRNGTTEEYQDMVDRCDIVQNIVDIVKQQYSAVSRAVTIHIDNNNELRMNGSGYIRG